MSTSKGREPSPAEKMLKLMMIISDLEAQCEKYRLALFEITQFDDSAVTIESMIAREALAEDNHKLRGAK